jgi:hypothetical protein
MSLKVDREIEHVAFNKLYGILHDKVLVPREKATVQGQINVMKELPLLEDNMCGILSFLKTNGIELSEHDRNEMVYTE